MKNSFYHTPAAKAILFGRLFIIYPVTTQVALVTIFSKKKPDIFSWGCMTKKKVFLIFLFF